MITFTLQQDALLRKFHSVTPLGKAHTDEIGGAKIWKYSAFVEAERLDYGLREDGVTPEEINRYATDFSEATRGE